MKEIYLDNSATTRVCPQAAQKALEMMTACYGNPSSLHTKGLEAQHELDQARRTIADSLGVLSEEIVFTSGGTEANNTAVLGAAHALSRRGRRIVTTAVEHSSVGEAMEQLEKEGFEVIRLFPDISGTIPMETLASAITADTILVSMMAVNNELGFCLPISSVKRCLKASGSPGYFHVDAVQAYQKQRLRPLAIGADLLSISGHKVHAPKGVGALYIRKGVRIHPLHRGGLQEKKLRPGTEPVPAISAFGAAVEAMGRWEDRLKTVNDISTFCRRRLEETEGVLLNSPERATPYILNFSVPGLRSETLLHFLAQQGIYVSSGSACAKGQKSHVLRAVGLSPERIDSAVRVSFSEENTSEEVDFFIKQLEIALRTLARKR